MWKIGIIAVNKDLDLKEEFPLKRLKHTEYNLTLKQRKILMKYGTQMQALMDGSITPLWAKGKHFVAMCKGLVEPADEYENIWKSYLLTLEEEKRLKEIYRVSLKNSQQRKEYLQRLFLGDECRASEDTPSKNVSKKKQASSNKVRTRKCPRCKGAGGDCPRCSRGWIVD
jgi:uncharacterized protein YifE (UPF0438 family)